MSARNVARAAIRLLACLLTVFAAVPLAASAQDFPSRPLRIVAPIAPGGLTDTLARELAARLGERLGQPVTVENRPGGGGVIGMQAAARAPADGHTLVLVYPGVAAVNPSMIPNLAYDIARDFAPVGGIGSFPFVLLAHPGLPARSAADLIDLARRSAPALAYGSAGNATGSHLATELWKRRAGVDLVHVPYKGEAPALADVVAGVVPLAMVTPSVALPMVRAGRVRALGVSAPERSPVMPEVPTLAEAGVAGYESVSWYGLLVPAGTPPAAVARLERELDAVLADPAARQKLESLGITPRPTAGTVFGRFVRDETERLRRLIQEAGIRAD